MLEFIETFKAWAESFGALPDGKNCHWRMNIAEDAFETGGAFFGYVEPTEARSGPYHDFSLVVFPDNNEREWLVALGVGSLGFNNDYELASQPGIRRRYQRLVTDKGFIKSDFRDIEKRIPNDFYESAPHLKTAINRYKTVLSACEIVNPYSEEGARKIKGFLALYADIREWGSNNTRRKAISESIAAAQTTQKDSNDEENVCVLLTERKYVVLQGPPGTGKTRLAKRMADKLPAKVFFNEYHAETSYAEFVQGLRPKLNSSELIYESIDGALVQSIKYAQKHTNEKVVLIIDEINRANLSNVLGPVFYLFEYQMDSSNVQIAVTDTLSLDKLPENLYVVATMNTADRSLAVVDFALRRRFAWYTLWPKAITPSNGLMFFKEYFDRIEQIFEQYASDEELNLQPGQGYFLAHNEDEMKQRLRYEVLPLVKEYLVEGLLSASQDEFNDFFHRSINKSIFR